MVLNSRMSTNVNPIEIDTQLADLYDAAMQATHKIGYAVDAVHRSAGDKTTTKFGKVWERTTAECVAIVPTDAWAQHQHAENVTRLQDARRLLADIEAQAYPMEQIYALNPWSRFFLVKNNNGHIHSSMSCGTCFDTTEFGWLPTVSGKTEAEAVAEFGEILCTVCFPSAPVEWTNGVSKATKTEREAKAAAKAERAAAKLAKALLPDGSPLRVGRDSLVSLRSAQMWLTDSFSWNRSYPRDGFDSHPSYELADVRRVAEAVAAKTEQDVEAVLASHKAKAAKRDGVMA